MNVCLPLLALFLVYHEDDVVIKNASYCKVIINRETRNNALLLWISADSPLYYRMAQHSELYITRNMKEALSRGFIPVVFYNAQRKEVEFHAYSHFDSFVEKNLARNLDRTAELPDLFYSWIRGQSTVKKIEDEANYRWCNLF